jgi:hypothetical protein
MALRSRGRRLVATGATVTALALAGASQAAAQAAPSQAAPSQAATIAVDTGHSVGQFPAGFVGLSFEMRELGVGSFDAAKGNLVALFGNLGRSNIRISGNTLDRDTLWLSAGQSPPQPLPSWVQDIVTPADFARLGRFLEATGWRAEVGISMGHFDPSAAASEASAAQSLLGPHLAAVECGNEPNDWAGNGLRTAPYGYPQYRPEWEACASAAGSARIAGPDTSAPTSTGPWTAQFAQDERSRISMLTIHNYAVSATSSATGLLSPQTDASEVSSVASELATAKAEHLPIRLDETNSASGGGILGVSDTYASALWAMDYSLLMAQDGFSGLNFHGGLGVCDAPLYNGKYQIYTPICAANAADAQAKIYTAAPEYYGLYMAARMGPGRFLPVSVHSDHNVTAYAVRGADGRVRIAVIEKDDPSGPQLPVTISVGRPAGSASVIYLRGPSLSSAQGVTVQGSAVNRQGLLHPGRPGQLRVKGGTVQLSLPSGSAAIITLGAN